MMNKLPDQGHDTPVRVRIIWDAGIAPPVGRWLEQAERDLFLSLARPHPGARKVRDVQFRDFTLPAGDIFLWAEGGFAFDSPAQHQIAVGKIGGVINVLLGHPRLPDELVPAHPGTPDAPVLVRVIWDAGIAPPVARGGWSRPSGSCFSCSRAWVPAPTTCGACSTGTSRSPQEADLCSIARHCPPIAVGKSAGAVNVLLRWPPSPDPFLPVEPPRYPEPWMPPWTTPLKPTRGCRLTA